MRFYLGNAIMEISFVVYRMRDCYSLSVGLLCLVVGLVLLFFCCFFMWFVFLLFVFFLCWVCLFFLVLFVVVVLWCFFLVVVARSVGRRSGVSQLMVDRVTRSPRLFS